MADSNSNLPLAGYPIRVKSVTPQRLVVGQIPTVRSDWGGIVEQILAEVWRYLNTFEDITVGPPMARLHGRDDDDLLVEAGFPVVQPVAVESPFLLADFPGGEAATVLLHGPYERLPEAHAALADWLKQQARHDAISSRMAVAPWMIFWATPDDVSLPSELRTELVWPL